MKILADQAIPNAYEIFSTFGTVELKYGRDIQPSDLKGVDALMVRSVTKVNASLIKEADQLKFVGTATAGIDHVDTEALAQRHIKFAAAPGCNASSVADYVLSVWMVLAQRYGFDYSQMSIGIVGLGHVGTRVYRRAQALGMKIICCDPLRAARLTALWEARGTTFAASSDADRLEMAQELSEGDEHLWAYDLSDPALYEHSLAEVLACDIVTLHVPLTQDGPYPTFHLLGKKELASLHQGQVLLNTARGPVVDNQALYALLRERPGFVHAWFDVFEQEPSLLVPELIPYLEGCSAHIAGYALEAKNRGTQMVAQAMIKALNLKETLHMPHPVGDITHMELSATAQVNNDLLSRIVFSIYDVRRDDSLFRRNFVDGPSFDQLRKSYQERHELTTFSIKVATKEQENLFARLGFCLDSQN